jgi:4-hydroxy-tetrahydrodipicolinate reductase
MTINIAVTGASGRMGKTLIEAISQNPNAQLTAAIEWSQSPAIGSDAGELAGVGKNGVVIVADLNAVINDFDVLVDFTTPTSTVTNAAACSAADKKIVIGTTGCTDEDKLLIANLSEQSAVCMATNFSTGVNLCFKLAKEAAAILGDDYDVEIVEAHHRHKVDAPSGTALSLGEAVAEGHGRDFKEVAVLSREGQVGPRSSNEIGFATIRGGDVVGDHVVMFMADGERVEIGHKASSRMSFGRGAIRAAVWLATQDKGLFDMQDVLGFK